MQRIRGYAQAVRGIRNLFTYALQRGRDVLLEFLLLGLDLKFNVGNAVGRLGLIDIIAPENAFKPRLLAFERIPARLFDKSPLGQRIYIDKLVGDESELLLGRGTLDLQSFDLVPQDRFAIPKNGGLVIERSPPLREGGALILQNLTDALDIAAAQKILGEDDLRRPIALGKQTRRLCPQRIGLVLQNIEIGLRLRVVETEEDVSLADLGALARVDLADDAALEMLHKLKTRFVRHRTRRHDSAVDLGPRSPGADTPKAGEHDNIAKQCNRLVIA